MDLGYRAMVFEISQIITEYYSCISVNFWPFQNFSKDIQIPRKIWREIDMKPPPFKEIDPILGWPKCTQMYHKYYKMYRCSFYVISINSLRRPM